MFDPATGEEREVGQSWTGGLAQGCAPVFQPFGEPGGGSACRLHLAGKLIS